MLGAIRLVLLAVPVSLPTMLPPGDAADVRNNEDVGAEQVAALRKQLPPEPPSLERFTGRTPGILTGGPGRRTMACPVVSCSARRRRGRPSPHPASSSATRSRPHGAHGHR
ncbi:hypothetical protein [Streptomyces griseomycini]|uniref:Uncharacterized protein n=1 Tax=Streptomyces griseomycini TaxID=66895 RepID=A0A7W7V9Y9_9ACTN|nr:hypothetical protein [Streptomyces griseomycini]MBB4902399.1 hypothetical protein [Streptomyces griseomycini]